MKTFPRTLRVLGAATLALGACQSPAPAPEPERLPEIRYFMIADT